VALLSSLLAVAAVNAAYSQFSGATGAFQQQQQEQQQQRQQSLSSPSSSPSSFFESQEKGIRVQVPGDYAVEDPELLSPELQQLLDLAGVNLLMPQFLLHVCPDELALPMTGGQHKCQEPQGIVYGPREGTGIIGSADAIHVMRFDNLRNNPEFEGVVRQNRNITADDLIAFNVIWLVEGRGVELDVLRTANTTVNYYPEGATANQAPVALPAKVADLAYALGWNEGSSANSMEYRGFFLHVLGPDGNTGYILGYEQPSQEVASLGEQPWITPLVAQVFDSFELIEGPAAAAAAALSSSEGHITSLTPTQQQQSPQSQPQQQMQQPLLNQGASVSIVQGSSSLTTDAFQPNPVQVNVGDAVTWTNDDTQPHSATSSENTAPDAIFDSGIMFPGATFEHTFTEAGEYPYFCLLHPNQVGTVSVR
jgi:plastocyanin